MSIPKKVRINEMGPRDGLQNEKRILSTEIKLKFIDLLLESGLETIEATSFVLPKLVPQMADSQEVMKALISKKAGHFPVLVPNMKGFETALDLGVKEFSVICTPSKSFSWKNCNCNVEEGLSRCLQILKKVQELDLDLRAYISCSLDCPYEGKVLPDKVEKLATQLFQAGCTEIVLADTTGKGTPNRVEQLIQRVTKQVPIYHLGIHFHDTYGQALPNTLVALQHGIEIIDSSVAGIGGCPFAKGASGNVATEDLLFMLSGMHIETGVNLQKLLEAGEYICKELGRESGSKVAATSLLEHLS